MKNFETEPNKGLEILQQMAGDLLMRFEEGQTTPDETAAVEAYLQEHDPIPFDERLILADLQQQEKELKWYPLLPLEELDEALEIHQEQGQTIAVCRWEEPDFTFGIQLEAEVPFLIYQTRETRSWFSCCNYGLVSIDPRTRQVTYHNKEATGQLGWAQIAIQGEAGERPTDSIYGFRIPLDPASLQEAHYLVLTIPVLFESNLPISISDSHPWMQSELNPGIQELAGAGRRELRGIAPQILCAERDGDLGISYRVEARDDKPFLIVSCDNKEILNRPCVLHFYWQSEGAAKDYYWNDGYIFRELSKEAEFALPGDADVRLQSPGYALFNCDLT